MKYTYARVKIDSKKAISLQAQGYPVINTDALSGYVTFEIEKDSAQIKKQNTNKNKGAYHGYIE